jgi:uncharacterized protein (TIGR03086 family)
MDPLDLFERGSSWTASKISGAKDLLDSPTGCDKWSVRSLVNHLLDGAEFFAGSAQGKEVERPGPEPRELLGDDPVAQYEDARQAILEAYKDPAVQEKTGPLLGIAFCDHLIHGWDLAKGTGQAATIPPDLAEAAFQMLNGRLTSETRGDAFKEEVNVDEDASPQDKLLAYVGRQP